MPHGLERRLEETCQDLREKLSRPYDYPLAPDGATHLGRIRKANQRSQLQPHEAWPWQHTLTVVIARHPEKAEAIRGAAQHNNLSIRPYANKHHLLDGHYDIDCITSLPNEESTSTNNVLSTLANLSKDTGPLAIEKALLPRGQMRNLDYIRLYVTVSVEEARIAKKSEWIPIIMDTTLARHMEYTPRTFAPGYEFRSWQISTSKRVEDTGNIVSLNALPNWRPPRWYAEARFGFPTDSPSATHP